MTKELTDEIIERTDPQDFNVDLLETANLFNFLLAEG